MAEGGGRLAGVARRQLRPAQELVQLRGGGALVRQGLQHRRELRGLQRAGVSGAPGRQARAVGLVGRAGSAHGEVEPQRRHRRRGHRGGDHQARAAAPRPLRDGGGVRRRQEPPPGLRPRRAELGLAQEAAAVEVVELLHLAGVDGHGRVGRGRRGPPLGRRAAGGGQECGPGRQGAGDEPEQEHAVT